MNKGELVNEVCERLRASGVRKVISSPKHVFHITDDEGNTCNFNVKRSDRRISFNQKDVLLILDTCLDVIEDILEDGKEVNLYGFGIFSIHKRASRRTKIPGSNEWVEIEAHNVPKFSPGKKLKMAAKLNELKGGGK